MAKLNRHSFHKEYPSYLQPETMTREFSKSKIWTSGRIRIEIYFLEHILMCCARFGKTLVAIFIVSILVHHIFEKQYLKLGMRDVFLIIFVLIGANAYLQYSVRNDNFWAMDLPAETKEIVHQNIVASKAIWEKKPRKARCIETSMETPFNKYYLGGYCRYPRGTGNMSILVIGNSYVVNLVENIRAPFNKNYSDFRYLSVFSSFGLYSGFSSQSKEALDFTKQQVEKYKPDVLFVVARYLETIKDPVRDNDPLVQQMDETIESMKSRFVKKIYILGAHPTYKENFLDTFLQYLLTWPHKLDLLHLDKKLADASVLQNIDMWNHVFLPKTSFIETCSGCAPIYDASCQGLDMPSSSMYCLTDSEVPVTYTRGFCSTPCLSPDACMLSLGCPSGTAARIDYGSGDVDGNADGSPTFLYCDEASASRIQLQIRLLEAGVPLVLTPQEQAAIATFIATSEATPLTDLTTTTALTTTTTIITTTVNTTTVTTNTKTPYRNLIIPKHVLHAHHSTIRLVRDSTCQVHQCTA
ncbi:Protein CBG17864 [Caenorhabditis briggsae]|uniref:Protein CBG17864 n=1 Tax=Caenorhabditis briggsae TaxID=6238 RepID=A8XRZ0_CAEBR|nr:Protein CBG17864 [Caenorhabditis briggsae]CAP35409.2 Protein CBG17864 [Caenorhabditis briggsae]